MKTLWNEIVVTDNSICRGYTEYVIGTTEDTENYCRTLMDEDPCMESFIVESFFVED